ncbi:DUF4158 domain-containing protein [Goodfellowiella coeruleoviolacea]|uniref:DUF4158 domain-containing protein n=1 Tax=Goodfellowiella coeruleoviolacea TaxID=334858 RepID=UPI0020A45B79|nr:DUF4158 domain-containing protein [Goodfellowiella coeruleoviolacea]
MLIIRPGYFPKLEDVPLVVVDHVRGELGLGEDVTTTHESPRTAKWHRQLVRRFVGVTYEPAKVRAVAESAIRKAVQHRDQPALQVGHVLGHDQRGLAGRSPGR